MRMNQEKTSWTKKTCVNFISNIHIHAYGLTVKCNKNPGNAVSGEQVFFVSIHQLWFHFYVAFFSPPLALSIFLCLCLLHSCLFLFIYFLLCCCLGVFVVSWYTFDWVRPYSLQWAIFVSFSFLFLFFLVYVMCIHSFWHRWFVIFFQALSLM